MASRFICQASLAVFPVMFHSFEDLYVSFKSRCINPQQVRTSWLLPRKNCFFLCFIYNLLAEVVCVCSHCVAHVWVRVCILCICIRVCVNILLNTVRVHMRVRMKTISILCTISTCFELFFIDKDLKYVRFL